MTRCLFCLFCLFCLVVTLPLDAAPYTSAWDSLSQHPVPEWFRDAKFGIYFHWGPYSVPGFKTEWYSHYMYVPGHPVYEFHKRTYGSVKEFGYKNFIPMFKAEHFDADAWATLFKRAGARFAGPVAEHADGFAMWDSDLTHVDAAEMGPQRDIVGEMERAVRKQGLKFITTLHHQWLYAWYPTMDPNTDTVDPAWRDLYGPPAPRSAFALVDGKVTPPPDAAFNHRWLSRAQEVVTKYRPDLVWFDNKLRILQQQTLTDFLDFYYNSAWRWGRDVVATYKHEEFAPGAGVLDLERSRMAEGKDFPWLTDDSIDWNSWSYVRDPHYKTVNRLIDFLVDVVSKNGCVLLNIPPTPDGRIPWPVQERLLAMGRWLDLNGEAIYESRPWKIYGEGPLQITEGHLSEKKNPDSTYEDIRFTTRGGLLYAIALDWPPSGRTEIRSLGTGCGLLGTIHRVQLVGYSGPLTWRRTARALVVELPEARPCEHAFVLRITADGI